MQFDIVSDLHVEHWSNHPYDWERHRQSDNVIIAGDVADDLQTTVNQLNIACDVYKRVVYVTGNHEATQYYHNLSLVGPLVSYMMGGRENFFNLDTQDMVIDEYNLAIVGKSGWWDFRVGEPAISFNWAIQYFDVSWCRTDKNTVVNNILNEALHNFLNLQKSVDTHQKDGREICLVTHTVPHKALMSVEYPSDTLSSVYYGNSLIRDLFKAPSVKYAIFGHCHDRSVSVVDDTICVNNARGRPQDYNKECYEPYTIIMGEKKKK